MKKIFNDEFWTYLAIAMAFMLSGCNISNFWAATLYGASFRPEFAFLPEWTVSPIFMLVIGIVSAIIGTIYLIFLAMDASKKKSLD